MERYRYKDDFILSTIAKLGVGNIVEIGEELPESDINPQPCFPDCRVASYSCSYQMRRIALIKVNWTSISAHENRSLGYPACKVHDFRGFFNDE